MSNISMEELDKSLRKTEVSQRKKFLNLNLKRLGVYQSKDGRRLEDLSLYDLEWLYIEVKNDRLREEQQFD